MRPLRVAVDARFIPGTSGGVETVAIGLAQGFAEIPFGGVSLIFVTYAGLNSWIDPYSSSSLRSVEVSPPSQANKVLRKTRLWAVRPHGRSFGVLPGRDRAINSLDVDIVHLPRQTAGEVDRPFIYHPHDLQHRHLPNFFTARQIASREVVYGSLCRKAAAVAVGTSWVKRDLIEQMRIDPKRIFVIPLAPATAAGEQRQRADLVRTALPDRYIIYPAASWPHKNHIRLFEALAILRGRGIEVPLILTGPRHMGLDLSSLAINSGVRDLVFDLGYLSQLEVEALIEASVAMIVPTLFEAASFPVWEAFRLGTAVACSNVTSLPQQVGTSGLLFDADRREAIADAIVTLWEDPIRRKQLADLGRARVNEFNWKRTAEHFLALYHHVGGRKLSAANQHLLEKEPIL